MNAERLGYLTAVGVGLLLLAAPVRADVLQLDYTVTADGPGLYLYNFQLELTNADSSWSAGQGWGWITFGACEGCNSPLTDWNGISVDSPYINFGNSSGYDNGPTLQPVLTYWVPTAVGDTLNWSGTSTADLGQGQLLYTTLLQENGAEAELFQVADDLSSPVPEPGSFSLLMAMAVALFGFVSYRRGRRERFQ